MRIIFLVLTLSSAVVMASIPKDTTKIEKILHLKTADKFAQLKKLGPQVYADLKKIAFDEKHPLGTRWQAFMSMVRLGERESLPEIDQALKSKEWFLKNAALRTIVLFDENKAYEAALKSLDDPALVVRSQAVITLGELKKAGCTDKLWKQLYAHHNYLKNQSLWIRRDIVKVLSEVAPQGSEAQFVKVLGDADSTLFAPAIKGLERLTGVKLGNAEMPAVYKRHLWKKWFEDKQKEKSIKS